MHEIIYGIHAIEALLAREPQRFLQVFIAQRQNNPRLKSLITALEVADLSVQMVNISWLDAQVEGAIHQGALAKIRAKPEYNEKDLPALIQKIKSPLLLILDGITDPHNLGACLRSADAAGVNAIIMPRDRSAKLNATVKKIASGAAENVPLIRVTNLARTLRLLQELNIWIIGTSDNAERTLYQSKMNVPMALVMGSEDNGIRRLTREYCDDLISIPMKGIVSSLNISVAAGVLLFEAVRQRQQVAIVE